MMHHLLSHRAPAHGALAVLLVSFGCSDLQHRLGTSDDTDGTAGAPRDPVSAAGSEVAGEGSGGVVRRSGGMAGTSGTAPDDRHIWSETSIGIAITQVIHYYPDYHTVSGCLLYPRAAMTEEEVNTLAAVELVEATDGPVVDACFDQNVVVLDADGSSASYPVHPGACPTTTVRLGVPEGVLDVFSGGIDCAFCSADVDCATGRCRSGVCDTPSLSGGTGGAAGSGGATGSGGAAGVGGTAGSGGSIGSSEMIVFDDGYVVSGPWHGYSVWDSDVGVSGIQVNQNPAGPLCIYGVLDPKSPPGYAYVAFRTNELDQPGARAETWTPTTDTVGVLVDIARVTGNPPFWIYIEEVTMTYCASLPPVLDTSAVLVPWSSFVDCTDGVVGTAPYEGGPIGEVRILVRGEEDAAVPYEFCIENLIPAY